MTTTGPRALVVTVVHRPHDARILHRQIAALLDAGWRVSYAAPWAATGQQPPDTVRALDLPRAAGRRRLAALRAARRLLRAEAGAHDVVLLHDPELLLALPWSGVRPVVWDVHEDPGAALRDRAWVPRWLRPVLRLGIALAERWAERRCDELLLAERSYAARFRRPHPLVLNVPMVPATPAPPGRDRVVHVGRHARSRGVVELVELGERLAGEVTVELIGQADDDVVELLREAHERGVVRWHGFVPNDRALALVRGAAAGLSLLHDHPNYRVSMPTKVVEYLAHGLPVVTTPLPEAVALVGAHDLGAVVDFGDVDAAEAAIRALIADDARRADISARGHALALTELDWRRVSAEFVQALADTVVHPLR